MTKLFLLFFLQLYSAWSHEPRRPASQHCLWPGHEDACRFCVRGWYGEDCSRNCSHCDSGGCDKKTGKCVNCEAGFYSEDCSLPCPQHCSEGVDGKVFCDRSTGHCRQDCEEGWWGDRCSKRCNENCKDSTCLYDGSCVWGCKDGWAGDMCTENCPGECKKSKCTLYGKCVHGCNTGFYGERCENRCSSNCTNYDCIFVHDIICRDGCKDGLMSISCDKRCPPACESCNQHTGDCITCTQGFWGAGCEHLCNTSCVNSLCEADGSCVEGCRAGFHGRLCDRECDTNCVECNRTNGECLVCRTLWDETRHVCTDSMPVQEDSGGYQLKEADTIPRTLIIGVVSGSVALLIILVVVVITCRYKKRREHRLLSEDPQPEDTGTSDDT